MASEHDAKLAPGAPSTMPPAAGLADAPTAGQGASPDDYVPLILQPRPRSLKQARVSAVHLAVKASAAMGTYAAIGAGVTVGLGPDDPWTRRVLQGCMFAMITLAIMASPELGSSFTKGVQRLLGVMFGGWLFFGLYSACQAWWFLAICLGLFAFCLVATSIALTGKQFFFPVCLATAFIVTIGFGNTGLALENTAVKTIGIGSAVVWYTLLAAFLLPRTSTQAVFDTTALALQEIHELAEYVLVGVEEVPDGSQAAAAGAAEVTADEKAGKQGKWGKKAKTVKPGTARTKASVLAATAFMHTREAYLLLPHAKKEKFMGSIGSYRCFVLVPFSNTKHGNFPEHELLAVLHCMNSVLRVMAQLMIDRHDGRRPLQERRPPPPVPPAVVQAVHGVAASAVAVLQDCAAALPDGGGPITHLAPDDNVRCLHQHITDLVALTLEAQAAQPAASAADGSAPKAAPGGGGGGATPGNRWRSAIGAVQRLRQSGSTVMQLAPGASGRADQQHVAEAFGQVVAQAVSGEHTQLVHWINTLQVMRVLGLRLQQLQRSVNELLPLLPGASVAGAASAAAPAGLMHPPADAA